MPSVVRTGGTTLIPSTISVRIDQQQLDKLWAVPAGEMPRAIRQVFKIAYARNESEECFDLLFRIFISIRCDCKEVLP